jgi:AraC-like DNA-binding protein/mannose-6-phosphate isomerase-like protein (cupin superfamily)
VGVGKPEKQDNERRETVRQQFYLPDSFARSGGIWPLNTGQTVTKPGYRAGPRVLEYYNLHFIIEGRLELEYSDRRVVLAKGDVFAMFPGIVYTYRRLESPDPLRMVWVSFDGPQAMQLLLWSGFTAEAPYVCQMTGAELNFTLHQLNANPSPEPVRQVEMCAWLYRLFSLMFRPVPSAAPAGREVWLPKSLDYMHAHFMEKITVQNIADYVSLHRGYFSKIFTEQTGLPPVKYLQKLRMEKAAELLRAGFLTIEEIALTLGYPDPYSFTHVFSKHYGMPPGKWRAEASGRLP